ncbi:hypothetical protein BFW38_16225 [Terasakiispira papahanaumokuakeensis]|uniref:Uncharacterized protein n=1 Tax=Terasakiispira papahanaumokuakeensis TaxID=197479 RepID=A0A1E2VCY2_9GAMM|nr:hypothetical protein [Terasakiispira papahanaumokuakeensis]ODC04847.1 hypothetical protein BFW38_16225 [Terasakiispira papahanaumokuakeensis]
MPVSVNEIYAVSIALFERAPTEGELAQWQGLPSLTAVTAALLAADDRYAGLEGGDLVAAVVETLARGQVDESLMTEARAGFTAQWAAQKPAPATLLTDMALAMWQSPDPQWQAAKTVVVEQFEAALADQAQPGEAWWLAIGPDRLVGTAQDDLFWAPVQQNAWGQSANTLGTGDEVDGGAGTDTLHAMLRPEYDLGGQAVSINPITRGIEQVTLEALSGRTDTVLDAGKMSGVNRYTNVESENNLTIQDVRIKASQATVDIKLKMESVDHHEDFTVLFDSNSLRAKPNETANSAIVLRLDDGRGTDDQPLATLKFNLSFNINGNDIEISDITPVEGTYQGLVTAIQNALADIPQAEGLSVELGNAFTSIDITKADGSVVSEPADGVDVIIRDASGGEFEDVNFDPQSVGGTFSIKGGATAEQPDTITNKITSDITLDNVGRGSVGGDVVIGGMSGTKGVEKLLVHVDRDSNIASLGTTARTADAVENPGQLDLDEVVVDSVADGANGDLVIGQLTDVQDFDSNSFNGNSLTVTSDITDAVVARDLDMPGQYSEVNYDYKLGANNNNLTLNVAQEAVGHDDFNLNITGTGNNAIVVDVADNGYNTHNVNWYNNQSNLDNINVNTGSGSDFVWTQGWGDANISTGAGNDTIVTDNTGEKATWIFNGTGAPEDVNGNPTGFGFAYTNNGVTNSIVYKGSVTVTLSDDAAAALGDEGFEATVQLDDSIIFGSAKALNDAIKEAINTPTLNGERNELSSLLTAEDGPNGSLIIRSNIDGQVVNENLQVAFTPVDTTDATAWNSSNASTLTNAIAEATRQSDYALPNNLETVLGDPATPTAFSTDPNTGQQRLANAGTDSTAVSSNVVNAGAGDDLIVLGSGNGADTLVIDGTHLGQNTIVNFNAAQDKVDLSAYLVDRQEGTSGSDISSTVIPVNTTTANTVDLINNFVDAANGQTWQALDSASVKAHLDGSQPYTGFPTPTITTAPNNLHNSNNTHHVIAVENPDNDGEYKFFQIVVDHTDDTPAGRGYSVSEIGTFDFGDTMTVTDLLDGDYTVTTNTPSPSSVFTLEEANGQLLDSTAQDLDITVGRDADLTQEYFLRLVDSSITFSFASEAQTVVLSQNSYIDTNATGTLTIDGGILDASNLRPSQFLPSAGGQTGVVLNSTLILSQAQAAAMVADGTLFYSNSTTNSQIIVELDNGTDNVITLEPGDQSNNDRAITLALTGANPADGFQGSTPVSIPTDDIPDDNNGGQTPTPGTDYTVHAFKNETPAPTQYTITDGPTAIVSEATTGGDGSAILANATSVALKLFAGDKTVALTDLTNSTDATAIDFTDNAATLTSSELTTITGSLSLTEADAITVTGVAAGDVVTVDGVLSDNDTIEVADNGVISLSAAALGSLNATLAVTTPGTGNDATVTVNTLSGQTVKTTSFADTFQFADGDTDVGINNFVIGTDKLDFSQLSVQGTLAAENYANGTRDSGITLDNTNSKVYIIDNDTFDLGGANNSAAPIGSFSNLSDVAGFLNTGVTFTAHADQTNFFIIRDASSTNDLHHIYAFTDSGNDTHIDVNELTHVGSVTANATLLTTDLLLA